MHHKTQKYFKSSKGVIGKSILGLLLIWCLLSLCLINLDYYRTVREIEDRQWVYHADVKHSVSPVSKVSAEKEQISFISTRLVKLLDCPNVETIEADNKEALSYMTPAMAKRTSGYLEWRTKGIKRFRELNNGAKAYSLEGLKSATVNQKDLPDLINKSLLKEGGYYVLVQGNIRAFDETTGKEIHSKLIRRLVHLVEVSPTIGKPYSYLVDEITTLD